MIVQVKSDRIEEAYYALREQIEKDHPEGSHWRDDILYYMYEEAQQRAEVYNDLTFVYSGKYVTIKGQNEKEFHKKCQI